MLTQLSRCSKTCISVPTIAKSFSRPIRMGSTSSTNRMMASPKSSTTSPSYLLTRDSSTPVFIYGTAWKKEKTKDLVKQALKAGFRRIDTAAQPRHYQEHLVGEALRESYAEGTVTRQDVVIQTKYTPPLGQDLNNMPYHPLDNLETQIRDSISSSLRNFRHSENEEETYIDSLVIHSPLPTIEQNVLAFQTLATYIPDRIRTLGISNCDFPTFKALYESPDIQVKPQYVQNRFYPRTSHDVDLRAFCIEHGVEYQSFWTLTGNPALLNSQVVDELARVVGVEKEIVLYALVSDLGIVIINGTTSWAHMTGDLEGVRKVREWASGSSADWDKFRGAFARLLQGR